MEVQQMRRKISGTCILIMLMISSATSQQPANASIEGTVVDIETGQPIPGARLVLTRPAGVPAGLIPTGLLSLQRATFGKNLAKCL